MPAFVDWIRANTSGRVRRAVVGVIGVAILLAGIAMLVLPGPGIVVIILGLGVLSLEFAIAQTWLKAVQDRAGSAADAARVPRSVLWILPVAGISISIVFSIVPAFVGVVHGGGTWELVRKPHFSYDCSYLTYAELEAKAASGDDSIAHAMWQRVVSGRTKVR